MTYRYNLAAVLSAVVVLCCATLILGQKSTPLETARLPEPSNSMAQLRT